MFLFLPQSVLGSFLLLYTLLLHLLLKVLKVFEAFAGYGSQRMALKRCNIPHEIVGISEIEGDVILSYAAIHENLLEQRKNELNVTDDEMRAYLKSINVPLDYRTFKSRVDSLRGQKLKDMYLANKTYISLF